MSNVRTRKTADSVPEIDWSRAKRIARPGKARRGPSSVSLAEMRKVVSMTQAEVAAALGGNQAEVSRLEARSDNVLLSTLKRYAEALGARCEVRFTFPDGTSLELQVEDAGKLVE